MDRRLELQQVLSDLLGSKNVYFQPPVNLKIQYPCIIYQRSNMRTDYADNSVYLGKVRYTVTVIDEDPDSSIPAKVSELPLCIYDRFYVQDGLNHDTFTLFY